MAPEVQMLRAPSLQKPVTHCASLAQRSPTLPSVHELPAPAESGAHFPLLHSAPSRHGSPASPFVQTCVMPKSVAQNPETQSAAVTQASPTWPLEHVPEPAAPTQRPLLQSASESQRWPMAPVLHVPDPPELVPTQTFPLAQSWAEVQRAPSPPDEQVPTNDPDDRIQ